MVVLSKKEFRINVVGSRPTVLVSGSPRETHNMKQRRNAASNACALLAIFFCPIKKHLNHFLQLERPAAALKYILLDFAHEPLISARRRAAADPVAVFLK